MEKEFNEVIEILNLYYESEITGLEPSFVEKTISRRVLLFDSLSIKDYIALLQSSPEERALLYHSLYISYSEFFRNPLTFSFLEQQVLPMLIARKRKHDETGLRIWSAACAGGQEAYSLAILLSEINQNATEKINFQIFATDNNQEELSRAREGIFHQVTMNKVSLGRFKDFFIQTQDICRITPLLKQFVDFSVFDLLSDSRTCPTPSIYGNFDLIVCSNLLFYYKPDARVRILEKVGETMAPGAFLVTGETERDILFKNGFSEVFEYSAIFQKSHEMKSTRKYGL